MSLCGSGGWDLSAPSLAPAAGAPADLSCGLSRGLQHASVAVEMGRVGRLGCVPVLKDLHQSSQPGSPCTTLEASGRAG